MLRVALTGGLGSGKSTAAAFFAQHGAKVIQADEVARQMMQPGNAVYDSIVGHFGMSVLREDRTLDRAVLARIAFEDGRSEELNAIVHPAVIAYEEAWALAVGKRKASAVCIVESALIFETRYGAASSAHEPTLKEPWRCRFDRIVLVAASDALKIDRFVQRVLKQNSTADVDSLKMQAKSRLALQKPDVEKLPLCDFVLQNDGDLAQLALQVDAVWQHLQAEALKTSDAEMREDRK